MSKNLLEQIDDLVANKTFNLDALDGIKKIKDELSITLKQLDEANKKINSQSREIDRLGDQERQLLAVCAERAKEIADAKELIEAGKKALYEAEKHKAVADAWQNAMGMVFKPATVRETVYQSIPFSQNYGGNPVVTSYQQETKTTKEEL